ELLARNPEHVPGLRLLARIHWWQRDMEKLRSALERLAEAAQAAGLADEERYALTQLVRLAPDEQHFLDRLNVLGGVLEESAEATHFLDEGTPPPSFDSFAFGEIVSDAPPETPAAALEFEWNSVADDAAAPHPAVSFADLNEAEEPSAGELGSFARGPGSVDEVPVQPPVTAFEVAEEKPVSSEAMMRQELESVDFYITQGYSDIAVDTLEILERQFGSHPDIDARRKKLEAATQGAEAASLDFSDLAEKVAETKPVADLAAEEISFGEIVIDQPLFAPIPTAPVGSGIDSGLAEIFEEFRMEAEGESTAAQEDYETHYNMATAYKEMDLLDEAIREFQVAAGLTGSADGTPRYFHCCNMLGHCFAQKGMPQAAVTWFKKGLDAPGRNAEESKALKYELGAAYEQMGDLNNAVAAFTDVYGVD